jgi:hypothetical protein
MTDRPVIAALVRDLMLETRLEAAAAAVGARLAVCASLDELRQISDTQRPALMLVDLGDPAFPAGAVVDALPPASARPRLLGFYPHVQHEPADLAKRSGYDTVVPRSRFLSDTTALLRRLLDEAAARQPTDGDTGRP